MAARSLLLLIVGLLVAAWGGPEAAAQSTASAQPARLTALYPPSPVVAGTWDTYRVRIAPDVPLPIRYIWDFGDGSMSSGPIVAYAYDRPGSYTLTVTARNEHGADTLRTTVTVLSAEDAKRAASATPVTTASSRRGSPSAAGSSAPDRPRRSFSRSALLGSGGISLSRGGYTWVVASSLWDRDMRALSLDYRLSGYRSGTFAAADGQGAPAYRVVLGQFDTREAALAARGALPRNARTAYLVSLDSLSGALPALNQTP